MKYKTFTSSKKLIVRQSDLDGCVGIQYHCGELLLNAVAYIGTVEDGIAPVVYNDLHQKLFDKKYWMERMCFDNEPELIPHCGDVVVTPVDPNPENRKGKPEPIFAVTLLYNDWNLPNNPTGLVVP